ncbi:hypothetical protein N7447_004166 [Penicillium robsamsonii]|uniref:uncharacterized protein n=1 Tax=Penicillium robsamsonii TaxID=1792511 RepID=UPI002546735C|nr:uncharacterized protein N7447_004166 [Penicillium robsamsonii]KAJ5827403.1 hypothetical protein N7447_004166 [Penicillium robsamsonii]
MRQIVDAERRFMEDFINAERASLEVDRGPCRSPYRRACFFRNIDFEPENTFSACFKAPAERELEFREGFTPCLDVPSDHCMSRPTIRHQDFSPKIVLVDTSNDVIGIIDYYSASCLCAGIPDHFQNWGDPLSEKLPKPEVKLPECFD